MSRVKASLIAMFCVLSSGFASAQTLTPTSAVLQSTVGAASAASTFTLTNNQAAPLTISGISVPSGFAVSGTTCPVAPATLAVGFSCSISVTYTPAETGAAAGALTVTSSGSNSPLSSTLTGVGTTGGATSVTPYLLNFAGRVVGSTSPAANVTFTNNGAGSITIGSVQVTGSSFAMGTNQCTATLAAGKSCKIYVTVTPAQLGLVSGLLTISDSADANPVTVDLQGAGLAQVTLSGTGINDGSSALGVTSAPQFVTLYNNQSTPLTISSIQVNPTGTFAVAPSSTCSTGTVPANSSCTIGATMTPGSVGAQSASLTINNNSNVNPVVLTLQGTGVAPVVVSPASVNFGTQVAGTTSGLHVVTLKNNLTSTLSLASLSVTAGTPFSIDPSSTCLSPSVAAGGTCTIALAFSPAGSAVSNATLTINDGAANSPQMVTLIGTGIQPVTLSSTLLSFGAWSEGATSTAKTITLKNSQTSALALSQVLFSGPFSLDTSPSSATTCPTGGGSVPAGTSCVIGIVFKPTAVQNYNGQITVVDSAGNSPQTAVLTGAGELPATLAPTLNFGNVIVSTTSAVKNATLTNLQAVPLNITSITVPLPYAISTATTTCAVGTPIAPGASCVVSVTLKPSTMGAQPAATLSVVDDAGNSPQSVPLTGTGVTAVGLSPASLSFGNVVLQEPVSKTITITNNQAVPLSFTGITGLTAAYSPQPTSTCQLSPATLAPGLSCTLVISFNPTALTSYPATLMLQDSAPTSPQSIVLSGTGTSAVAISPGSWGFPAQYEGTTSLPKTFVLTNEQAVPLSITGAVTTGNNASDFNVTTNCPTAPSTLPAHGACDMFVTFTPSGSGNRFGNLVVSDNVAGSPQVVPLSGPGNAPILISPNLITTFGSYVGTTSALKTVVVNNTDAVAHTISSIQFTGDFVETATTCPLSPATLASGASCNVTLSFDPTIGGVRAGQMLLYDDAITSPQVANFSGTGFYPLTISGGGGTFIAQKIGTISPPKNITLFNHEAESETFTLTTAGPFLANSNCASGVIAAHSSCNLSINFAPTTTGALTGSLTVTDSAPGGIPIIINLSGSGTTTNPPAAVMVVSPGAGTAGTVVNAIITGNGWTNFGPSSVVTFDDPSGTIPNAIAVTVPAPASTTANTIHAQFNIAANAIPGARNIRVVTGSETARLTAAFIIADTSNSHVVTTALPNMGTQGQTLNVSLTATGTNFVQGVTFANFGDGIVVNSLTILTATTATANITISNTTFIGYRTITLVTGGEYAVSGSQAFQILPNSAALVSVAPNTAPQGANLAVNVVGTGTHWLQNATTFAFTGGINVGNVQVNTPTTATVNLAVTQGASVGVQNMSVATGGEVATLSNAFTVTGSTPYLVSVTPSSGQQGQTENIEIIGQYTNFGAANLIATLGGDVTVNSYNVKSPTDVVVNITISTDAAVNTRTAQLVSGPTGGETIFPFSFTVTPSSASIVSVTPSNVPQGGQLTLTVVGSNTHWIQGTTTSAFYPDPNTEIGVDKIVIIDSTHATLNISVPPGQTLGANGFYMATGGEVVTSSVSVYANTPTLSMTPANGMPGTSQSVAFTGQFTNFGPTTLAVVSGQGVSLQNLVFGTNVSALAKLVVAPGATPGLRLITFTTGGEIVTTYFNVVTTPVYLYAISPYHSPQANTLNVEITGVNTHFTAGTTVVNIDPQITVNSTTVKTLTDLVSNITISPTATIGWHTVYVNTGTEQVIIGFYVDGPQAPSLVSVVPGSAAQGAEENVVITGSLTHWVQGQTELILGAGVTVSNFTVTSPTTAMATISASPTAPVGGNSVITITGSEIVSGTAFSVTPSAAEISIVKPTCSFPTLDITYVPCTAPNGPPVVSQLQTISLGIVGVDTHWVQGETMASFGSGVITDTLTVTSPTSATVQITVLSSSPVGFASLTMSTDGENVTLQQAIDIEEGFPVLLSTSPGSGLQGATINMQLLGRFTNWAQGVTTAAFNRDVTVNSVTVTDSDSAIANITISPLAYVDYSCSPSSHTITITTGSEQESLPGTLCVGQGPAQVTQVSPAVGVQGSTETVTITGSETHWVPGETIASFEGGINVGNVTVSSPTTATVALAVTTSAPTGFSTVTMTTLGEAASQQFAFQVTPGVATLNEAIPNQVEQGVQNLNVHLIGQYSHFNANSTATFGQGITVNSVTYTDATDLMVNISISPLAFVGTNTVTVSTPGVPCVYLQATGAPCAPGATTGSEIVSDNAFSIIAGPAIITSAAPGGGNQGQEIILNIAGSNTHWAQNITQFWMPGAGSDIAINSVVINSPTSATADVTISPTAGLGARSIYMVTAGEALTDSGAFVVTGGIPVITYLSPNNAPPGTNQLLVTINGLYTKWDSTTTVSFGPGVTVTQVQVESSTAINAVINIDPNAQQGYRTVFVQTGMQGLTSNFQVYSPPPPVPYISYFWPSSGLPGQTFTVSFTGSNTHWDPATTTPTFGDGITVNTFQVLSPTSAIANITISPTTYAGNRLVTLATGTEVDGTDFNVVIAQPILSVVDPGSGIQGNPSLDVNIIGQYTVFDNTTVFNFGQGVTVNSTKILGPTIATVNVSIAQLAQLGGRGVSATTGGVTVGGAGFSVTPSLALISAIVPNTSQQGQVIVVQMTGQNTHWSPATVFQFGSGIVVANTVVTSPTAATLTLSIPALAPIGPTGASATTLGEVATITNGFVVQAGTPLLLSSGPGTVLQQGSATFTVLSQATQWTVNPPVVDYGAGIVLTNMQVTGDTSLTIEGYVQPTTPVGYRNLTVTTGAQVLSIANAVYVNYGPAVVNAVSPTTAGQGASLTVSLTGINTHWVQGVTQLTFPEVLVNSFTVTSPTTATANITVSTYATPGLVNVTLTTMGEVASKSNAFEITQTQPEMLYINSATGAQGLTETVTITGLYTTFGPTTTASFGTGITVNSLNPVTTTSLQANITIAPTTALGYRNVSVTTGTQVISSTTLFQVVAGPANIVSVSPNAGGEGQSLTVLVTGSQTHFAQGTTTAAFSGGISVTGLAVVDALHANVTISVPNSTPVGIYNVVLTTGGEVATELGGFQVNAGAASIATVTPPTGTQGSQNVSVKLTGLFTNWVNNTSVASFGAGITVTSLTVTDATDATANINISPTAAVGSRTVTVTTSGQISTITGGFSVLAGVPSLVTALPSSAQAGTSANVVIMGQFTTFQAATPTVSFGAGVTVNSVMVASETQLTANITIASNASVGARTISVTTGAQNVNLTNGFTVLAGTPVVTQINPNIGTPGAVVNVTVYGQYTNWMSGMTSASFGAGITVSSVVVNSATQLTIQLTLDPAAALGPRTVVITTGGEVENVPAGFTVQPAVVSPPTVISLSPGANAGGMPINSTITAVFSQPMSRPTVTSSNVLLYLANIPNQGNIPVAGSVTLDASGRVLTFAPVAPLAVNATYYFVITNAVQDATGNALGYYSVYLYTTFSANTTAPTVTGVNPLLNATGVGTNATVELAFSADMNQSTQTGFTVSTGGNPIAGTYSWNSDSNCCSWGPGTLVTFTPSAPLAANTTYTVAYGSPLADTAGNALTGGSYTFKTGGGADTTNNSTGVDFTYFEQGLGTNFAPTMLYAKPVNPIDINTGTMFLYNYDSGKYIEGSVTVAANGLSAQFTPNAPLLPQTAYAFQQSSGNYDMDGVYLSGNTYYFVTGASASTTPPTVASINPTDGATGIPLNAQVVLHFSEPINPATISSLTVTPSGGSALSGTASLASDQVTLTFVPAANLTGNTTYTVAISGFQDLAGNTGSAFSSSFKTAASVTPLNLGTGYTSGGVLTTVINTPDANWTVVPTGSSTPAPAEVVGPGDTGWYGGWPANGPQSSWIALNPESVTGNTYGTYSRTFNLTGYSLNNLCFVGAMGVDDNGALAINGTPIMNQISAIGSLTALNIPLTPSILNAGVNTISLIWGSTDNSYEAFRLQGSIQTCGASLTGGLAVTGATPAGGSTNVPTNSTITLTFNNPLDPATVSDTTLPVMVGWNSNAIIAGKWVVSGVTATFTPDAPFPPSTSIYVGNCSGPYDTAGDTISGCYNDQILQFTTSSTVTAPANPFQVTAFSPGSNATGVGLRANVTATFNRSFNPGTINQNAQNTDFALYAGDNLDCTSYNRSSDNTTLSFNCFALPANTLMTALVNSNLQDMAGNGAANFRSQFTTAPYDSSTRGSIVTTRPGSGSTGIGVNSPLVLYTSLPVNASTVNAGLQVAENFVPLAGTVQVLDNGYSIVFTPTVPLSPGALIQWWINGALTDATYGSGFNGTNGYFYVVGSTATAVPAITAASPALYSNPVALNSVFDFQFNVPLNASTVTPSNIYLYDSHTGLNVPATYSMPQPNEVKIVPNSDVSPSAYIYLYITAGLQSTTSVPAQANDWYFYTGTTDDTTLPMVVSAVPYSGAGNVGVNVTPGVVFNKTIDPVSVNSTTFQITNAGTPLAGTYYINNTDTRISFVPNAPLPASTSLKMVLNGVTDLVGHPVTLNSTFQTAAGPDFQTPTVVSTSIPNNGSVPVNSTLTVQFSESMDITTFSSSNLRIYDYTLNTTIPAVLSWSGDQSVAYLTPASPLAAGRQYNLYVGGGTDLAGNSLNGVSYTFYGGTGSASTAPTVINFDPISGATNVGINTVIEAQFSASIDPNSLAGVTLSTGGSTVPTTTMVSAGNTVIQLVPSTPLLASMTYTLKIAGVKDPAGNVVSTVSNSFTTGTTLDINGPSVTTYNPPYNATVGTNVLPKFVFNKPLNPITVNGNTFRMSVNDTGQGVPLTVTPSANGLEVTLTPLVPLLPNSQYLIQACCGFQDLVGNNGNGSNVYFYTGAGADTTAPTVSINPVASATGIPLNAQVLVIANKPIDPTSWTQSSVQLLDNLSNPVAGTLTEPTNTTLSFVPTANLSPGITYTVKVSGFTDAMENVVAPTSSTFTTGTAASTSGLTLTSTNIPFGSTNVSATQQIVLTFSQILDPATVNASTLKVMDSWNSNYPLSGTYAVNGNQVTFTPTSPYAAGATIYVGECGGPTDVLGEVFLNGNCYNQQLVFFTVTTANPDTSPLSVLSVSPVAGATNVGVNAPVSITFNKAINPYSVSNQNALLFAGQGIQDAGSITLSADGRTITFNVGALYGGTAYTISLPAGGISDPSGNPLATSFQSTFTTLSYPETGNGSVQATNPTNNATGVPTGNNLTLYMNRPVNPATLAGNVYVTVNGSVVNGNLAATAGNLEIQFTPATPFPNGAVVQWFFSNVYDIYGDAFYGTSGTFYMAAAPNPTAAPQQTVVSPPYGSNSVPVNAEIDIAFNLPINPTTLTGGINFSGGPATITLASPNVVRIVPTTALSATTAYYVCTNGSLQGTDGTAIQTSCYSTYFNTTGTGPDTAAGKVKIGPSNGSVMVGTNAYIRLFFSKPVDATTINSSSVQVTTGGNPIPGTFSYAYTSGDVLQVNFSPVNPLPPSSTIKVVTSGLLDYAGNTFPSASSTFTTGAAPDLSQASVSYEFGGNTQNIGTNAAFTCLYTKPMDPSSFAPGSVYVYDYATGKNVPVTYTFSSDLMSVTLKPTAALTPSTQYNYECFNAIDLTGNVQSNNGGPYFTTGSGPATTAPQLIYANPPSGVTGVALNDNSGPWYSTSLMLEFSEALAENSIGNVTLTPQGGSPLATANHLELGDTTIVVQLPAELMPNTTYTFNVTGVTDYNGNALTPVTSTFTTGSGYDFNNPSVTAFAPANGATAVPVSSTASITFSEPMNPILVQGAQFYLRNHNTSAIIPTTISFNSTYTVATLTPTAALTSSTIYDIVETPSSWYLEDWAGNNLYNSNTATFTTAP